MIPQKHADEILPEEQVQSPVEEKQVLSVVEKKRLWLKPLMRVVGVVLPLVGGFASIWVTFLYVPLDYGDVPLDYGTLGPLEALLVGAGCALLFRSWWALLVVPLAFIAGEVLAVYLSPVVFSLDPLAVDHVGFGIFFNVIVGTILVVISALICTALYKSREKERQK